MCAVAFCTKSVCRVHCKPGQGGLVLARHNAGDDPAGRPERCEQCGSTGRQGERERADAFRQELDRLWLHVVDRIGRGLTAAANLVANDAMPEQFRVKAVTGGTAVTDLDATVGVALIR